MFVKTVNESESLLESTCSDCVCCNYSMHEVYVSFDAPHKLLALEFGGEQEMFGYSEQLLRGRTLQVFHGPTTDSIRITSAVKASKYCTATKFQLNFYEISGRCVTVFASFEPYSFTAGMPVTGCKISFKFSQVVTVLEDVRVATIMISADRLHQLQGTDFRCHEILPHCSFSPCQLIANAIAGLAVWPAHLSSMVRNSDVGRMQQVIMFIRNPPLVDMALDATIISINPRSGSQISPAVLVLALTSNSSPHTTCALFSHPTTLPRPCSKSMGIIASAKCDHIRSGAAGSAPVRHTLELLWTSVEELQLMECTSPPHTLIQTMAGVLGFSSGPCLQGPRPAVLCIDEPCDVDEPGNREPVRKCKGAAAPRRFYRTFWKGLARRLSKLESIKDRRAGGAASLA
jgi:hypothetical protein